MAERKSDIDDAQEQQEEKYHDELADFVMRQFDRARSHRDSTGISAAIVDGIRRYRGKYDNSELCKFDGITFYRNATGMLCRSAYNWLKDAYFNAQDKPWTLEPTPIPELPDSMKKTLNEAIANNLRSQLQVQEPVPGQAPIMANGPQSPEMIEEIIKNLRNTAMELSMKAAGESTKGMEKVISDQLIEAGFRDTLSEFLLDIPIFPYAVMKGPIIKNKVLPQWKGDKFVFKEVPVYEVERIDPINIYLSPDSTDGDDGEFIIEEIPTTLSSLNASRNLKGFYKDAIDLVIYNQRHNKAKIEDASASAKEMEDFDGVDRTEQGSEGYMFTVYEYSGRISGEQLIMFTEDYEDDLEEALNDSSKKVDTEWGKIDPYEDYECIIRVCNGAVIMLRFNDAIPIPGRGYFITSCYKVPGSPSGDSVASVIADEQDELNLCIRSRAYNNGMSSGPIAEVDLSRFNETDAPENIEPWDVFPVTTNTAQNNNSAPAIRFTNIPNVAQNLTNVAEEIWDKMHRISGIPPYMYGDARGSAPTLGAFSLQYAGATKGIKTIISNIDNDIIEKLITRFYYFNMVYHEDGSIKADCKVNVRGSAGLIAQEQRQARPLELLQALGPVLAQLDPSKAMALANETLSESGYDPSTFGTIQGQAQVEAANRMVGVQGRPPIDGRSAPAQGVAESANLPPQRMG